MLLSSHALPTWNSKGGYWTCSVQGGRVYVRRVHESPLVPYGALLEGTISRLQLSARIYEACSFTRAVRLEHRRSYRRCRCLFVLVSRRHQSLLHSSQLVAPVHLAMVADLKSFQHQIYETVLPSASPLKTLLPQSHRGLHTDTAHLGDTCHSKQLRILRRMVVVSLLVTIPSTSCCSRAPARTAFEDLCK